MTYSPQVDSGEAPALSAADDRAGNIREARRLPRGICLMIWALMSLALWSGPAMVAIWLIG